jgi:hypothetical protein
MELTSSYITGAQIERQEMYVGILALKAGPENMQRIGEQNFSNDVMKEIVRFINEIGKALIVYRKGNEARLLIIDDNLCDMTNTLNVTASYADAISGAKKLLMPEASLKEERMPEASLKEEVDAFLKAYKEFSGE